MNLSSSKGRVLAVSLALGVFVHEWQGFASESTMRLSVLAGLNNSFVFLQSEAPLQKQILRDGIGPSLGMVVFNRPFELGLFYLNYKLKDVSTGGPKVLSGNYSTSFMSVPLLYRFSLDQLLVGIGPSVSVRVTDEAFFSFFDYGVTLSIRFFDNASPVFADLRYTQGLSNLMDPNFQGSYPIVRLGGVQVLLGYQLF